MLVRDSAWEKIRKKFSETEKIQLRKAVTGETICPRGFNVESTKTPPELWKKLVEALKL